MPKKLTPIEKINRLLTKIIEFHKANSTKKALEFIPSYTTEIGYDGWGSSYGTYTSFYMEWLHDGNTIAIVVSRDAEHDIQINEKSIGFDPMCQWCGVDLHEASEACHWLASTLRAKDLKTIIHNLKDAAQD